MEKSKYAPMIGILAGMGPKSTAPFLSMVIEECEKQYGAKNDIDFPHIILYSLPTAFYVNKPLNHKAMKETIIAGLKRLEQTGVDFIAMPCNTAHLYFNECQKSISIPLLNIVEETVKKIPEKRQRIVIIATTPTMESQLYQNELKRAGHIIIEKKQWQARVNKIIACMKAGKKENAEKEWNKLLKEIKKERCTTIICACTDITEIMQKTKKMISIDSSRALAEAVVRRWKEMQE